MYTRIALDNLKTYGEIYNFDITNDDVTHLKEIINIYNGQLYCRYNYRYLSSGKLLSVSFQPMPKNSDSYPIDVEIDGDATKRKATSSFTVGNITVAKATLQDLNIIQQTMPMMHGIRDKELQFADIKAYANRLANLFKQGGVYDLSLQHIKALYTLFGKTDQEYHSHWDKFVDGKAKAEYETIPGFIQHIVDVLQLSNDVRLAFYTKQYGNAYRHGNPYLSFKMYTTTPDDACYNYTDPNVFFSHMSSTTALPQIMYPDANYTLPKIIEMIDEHRQGTKFLVLERAILEQLERTWVRKKLVQAAEQEAVRKLEQKIGARIEGLIKGEQFTFNDITFTKDMMRYEEQILQFSELNVHQFLTKHVGAFNETSLNFDTILDRWVNAIIAKQKGNGIIGQIPIKLHVKSSRIYVNDIRINKVELPIVLRQALIYDDLDEYNAYCTSISQCSLKVHEALANGVIIAARDPVYDKQITLKLVLTREKNRNYIVSGDKRWKLSDTNAILNLSKAYAMEHVINVLLSDAVYGLTGTDIRIIFESGSKLLLEQVNLEKALLQTAITQLNITEQNNILCANGKNISGYIVPGKLRQYIVEKNTCRVFEHPTGRYLCMVDKGHQKSTLSTLVNRFYALSNDSKLSKEIVTLNENTQTRE